MSATTKRDVEHQVCTKTCKRPQVPTKSKHRAKNAESQEGTKKRAPVKSKGKHLCQSFFFAGAVRARSSDGHQSIG